MDDVKRDKAILNLKEDAALIRKNQWVMVAMLLFTVAKVTALICATIIAIQVNMWIGAVLFLAAILFRITWTYVPADKPADQNKEKDQ